MRAFAIASAALITAGSLFSLRLHTVFDKRADWTRDAEGRFLPVLDALPQHGPVVFLCDWTLGEKAARRLQAQFALAPRLVVDEPTPADAAIVDLQDPAHLAAIAARAGLRVSKTSADGRIAVLRR